MAQQPGTEDEDGLSFEEVVDNPELDGQGPAVDPTPGTDDIEIVLQPDVEETPEPDPETPEPDEPLLAVEEDPAVEDDLDDEAKTYSKAVQKRIQREQRATRRAREEGQRDVLAERQAHIVSQRETFETRKQLADVLIVNIEGSIKEKRNALKAAKEAGETDQEADITSDLADLHSKKRQIEDQKASIERGATEFEDRAKTAVQPTERTITPEAQAYLNRNKWVAHPAFKSEAIHLRILDQQLSTKLSPSDPRYFAELDRMVAREMPLLKTKVQALSKKPATAGDRPRSAVAPGGRSAPGNSGVNRPAGSNRVVLTAADFRTMEEFKMDPKNPVHQKAYAKEKLNGRRAS